VLDIQGSVPGRGSDGIFSHRHCIQTGPGAHPASYPMGTGGSLGVYTDTVAKRKNPFPPTSGNQTLVDQLAAWSLS